MSNTPSSGKKDSAAEPENTPPPEKSETAADEPVETVDKPVEKPVEKPVDKPVEEPGDKPVENPVEKKDGSAAQATPDQATAGGESGESKIVYVSAPPAPKKKGARGIGALVAILSAGIFAAVYAAFVLIVSLIAPPVSTGAMLQYFAAPIYWIPVIVFALSYLLLVVIVNRAGWWAHVLGGFLVAVLVYVSFIGAALIMAGAVGGTASVVGAVVLSQLTSPLGFVAAVAAREVPIWVGGLVAKRGRTVTARNAEARVAYQRDLEAHRASMGGNTAV